MLSLDLGGTVAAIIKTNDTTVQCPAYTSCIVVSNFNSNKHVLQSDSDLMTRNPKPCQSKVSVSSSIPFPFDCSFVLFQLKEPVTELLNLQRSVYLEKCKNNSRELL